jgi:hypothetical protein
MGRRRTPSSPDTPLHPRRHHIRLSSPTPDVTGWGCSSLDSLLRAPMLVPLQQHGAVCHERDAVESGHSWVELTQTFVPSSPGADPPVQRRRRRPPLWTDRGGTARFRARPGCVARRSKRAKRKRVRRLIAAAWAPQISVVNTSTQPGPHPARTRSGGPGAGTPGWSRGSMTLVWSTRRILTEGVVVGFR